MTLSEKVSSIFTDWCQFCKFVPGQIFHTNQKDGREGGGGRFFRLKHTFKRGNFALTKLENMMFVNDEGWWQFASIMVGPQEATSSFLCWFSVGCWCWTFYPPWDGDCGSLDKRQMIIHKVGLLTIRTSYDPITSGEYLITSGHCHYHRGGDYGSDYVSNLHLTVIEKENKYVWFLRRLGRLTANVAVVWIEACELGHLINLVR